MPVTFTPNKNVNTITAKQLPNPRTPTITKTGISTDGGLSPMREKNPSTFKPYYGGSGGKMSNGAGWGGEKPSKMK